MGGPTTYPTFTVGSGISVFDDGVANRYDGETFGMGKLALVDAGIAQMRLNRLIS